MLADVDLKHLARMNAPERAFLSLYLAGPRSVPGLERRLKRLRKTLSTEGAERSEREHFDENVALVRKCLARNPLASGGLCIFACWALDVLEVIELTTPVKDLVCIDSSPYIRPLAELQDEYENVAVVVADNKRARIFLVSAAVPGPAETIEGNVKNHVRKGGWSQQRYERRRDKQLLLYAREISAALAKLDREEHFRRILLVGGKEILRIIRSDLPPALVRLVVGSKALDLGRGEKALNKDLWEMLFKEERRSEVRLWEKIRSEYLRGGLGVVGLEDVLEAARVGRVETMLVDRGFHPPGVRCRQCDHLHPSRVASCASCGSDSLFEVDVVNEICELAAHSGAETDFVDPLPALKEVGEIAALLRY